MRKIYGVLAGVVLGVAFSINVHADSIVQVAADAEGLVQVSPADLPIGGTYFWVLPGGSAVPMPCPPQNSSALIYQITDNQFLADETGGQVVVNTRLQGANSTVASAVAAQANAVINLITQVEAKAASQQMRTMARAMGMDSPSLPFPTGDAGDGSDDFTNNYFFYSFDTNQLWLEITNVSNGFAYVNLHNGTNLVYAILSTTNLSTPFTNWQVETEVWPTDTNCMPFNFPTFGRQDLFLRAEDWTGVTENGNTTPDWWFWLYYGTTALSDTNLDSTGNHTLLHDYTNGIDPNPISFAFLFPNQFVSTNRVSGFATVLSGVPSYLAVLVNDTNQTDAVWQPYTSSNIVATLGSTNGNYNVYVGLRGLPPDATQTWQRATVTLYAAAPLLTLTNPATSSVSQSPIQLQGYASHPLDSLMFDVSNAAGVFTNQTGFLTGQFYDPNQLAYTTNYFECSGVILNSGTNLITLHATDWAGNATNLSFTLDYSVNTNPPALSLIWPQDGTLISGSNFTLQAQVNDPTVTITAAVNGSTTPGLVEQNGLVWVQNLLVNAGTNAVTLTASNAFGGVTVANFNVVENDIGLVINPLTSGWLNQSAVYVNGYIGDPIDDSVWVNGVQATVNDDGSWDAYAVPVNPTGTATLQVQVYVGDPALFGEQTLNQPQPTTVVLAGYSYVSNIRSSSPTSWDTYTINWAFDSGGTYDVSGYNPLNEDPGSQNYHSEADLPADGPGFTDPGLGLTWDYFSADTTYLNSGNPVDFQRSSQAQVMIAPSGQQPAGTTNVYLVLAGASEFSDPVQNVGEDPGDLPLPPEWLAYQGQALVNTGITNENGEVLGAMLVSAPAGTTPMITPTITQFYYNKAASFDAQLTNVMKIVDATSGQDLTGQTNTAIVGQQMNLLCQLNFTNFTATSFQWTVPGYALTNFFVSTDAFQTNGYPIPVTATNNQEINFFWADGATNRVVQVFATIQGKMVTAQATFNVLRPTARIITQTSSVELGEDINGLLLESILAHMEDFQE
jgi:hypothetical protein